MTIPRRPAAPDREPAHDHFSRVIAVLGEHDAAKLAVKYGGSRLSIPKSLRADSQLVAVLGADAAMRLTKAMGGTPVEVPVSLGKRTRIIELLRQGRTVREVAQVLVCTERFVKLIKAEDRATRAGESEPA